MVCWYVQEMEKYKMYTDKVYLRWLCRGDLFHPMSQATCKCLKGDIRPTEGYMSKRAFKAWGPCEQGERDAQKGED